ncbi:hypothetical protein CO670_17360 [Rhizobium sp. J15]|nr:hypothetical protein CO670_17360 [Rhizobium sp. J15]
MGNASENVVSLRNFHSNEGRRESTQTESYDETSPKGLIGLRSAPEAAYSEKENYDGGYDQKSENDKSSQHNSDVIHMCSREGPRMIGRLKLTMPSNVAKWRQCPVVAMSDNIGP